MAVQVPEMFADYEREFIRNRQELDDRLGVAEALVDDAAQKPLSEALQLAAQAESALRRMEMEARSWSADARSSLAPKLRKYREELSERKRAVEAAKQAAARRSLLGDRADEDVEKGSLGKSVRDRQRLLDTTDGSDQATKRLEQARKEAWETERIGVDVMSDLRQQREMILNIRANVGEVSEHTSIAKKLIDGMMRRAMMNRMLTYAAVGIVLLALIGAVYCMLGGVIGSSPAAAAVEPTPVLAVTGEGHVIGDPVVQQPSAFTSVANVTLIDVRQANGTLDVAKLANTTG